MTICSNLSGTQQSELEHQNSNGYQRSAVNYILMGALAPAKFFCAIAAFGGRPKPILLLLLASAVLQQLWPKKSKGL